MTIKLFDCDLNWVRYDKPVLSVNASAPQDWADVNPQEYFDWHRAIGNNVTFCQAYAFGGYAFYPTRLGALAPGEGSRLLPRLFELSQKAKMPFWSYFCVGADLVMCNMRDNWLVPGSRAYMPHGFLAPESPWTDLLCARIDEFLRQYPVDTILFDWFVYGNLKTNDALVQPAWFVEKPFKEITGREMPKRAEDITALEHLLYKRQILARQFERIRDTVRAASPSTKIGFNVPYWRPNEELWEGHAMLEQSDFLFAECSRSDVMEWLLSVRKPHQRVMTTIIGRLDDGECDATSWRKWHAAGCDFFGYAWGTPPDFRPHPYYEAQLAIVREAFAQMK